MEFAETPNPAAHVPQDHLCAAHRGTLPTSHPSPPELTLRVDVRPQVALIPSIAFVPQDDASIRAEGAHATCFPVCASTTAHTVDGYHRLPPWAVVTRSSFRLRAIAELRYRSQQSGLSNVRFRSSFAIRITGILVEAGTGQDG